jgi:phage/plasmid primase-like uncharacterized protein
MNAAEIARRFNLRRSGRDWSGACPACGYPRAFKLSEGRSGPIWWCGSCTDRDRLAEIILGHRPAAEPRAPAAPDRSDRTDAARRLWDAARPIAGTIADRYLRARGLSLPPDPAPALRFLSDARHPSGARLPVLIASVRDAAGNVVAVHRTYLAEPGRKVAGLEPRATLGPTRGGACRLWPVAPELAIGEGLESCIAAGALLDLPAWSALSAGNLADTLQLPPEVRSVVIAADNDAPGLAAAKAAAARWKREGRVVRIAVPDRAGADFADVLAERAKVPA